MYKRLHLQIDVDGVLAAPRDLIQSATNQNRDRYKYTDWLEETAPGTPLLMYKLPHEVTESVVRQLPQQVLRREVPGVFLMVMPKPCAESQMLPPHVDRGRRAAINVYLKCAGETTEFYDADETTRTLSPAGSFTAKPGEAWLVDVSKPHAVRMREANERVGLSLSFRRAKFADLAELLASP